MHPEAPVNPIPPVILILFLGVVAVEATLSLADAHLIGGARGIGWRASAVQDWAFSPAVWDQVAVRHNFAPDLLRRFVTYAFVHGSFTQALFGGALLLALGKFVGDVLHWGAVLAVVVASTVIGAAVYGATVQTNLALLGVYPPVYGLIGAFTYLTWLRLGQLGQNQFMAFRLIGFLLALQLVWGLLFGGSPYWIAELSGFLVGLGLSPLVSPGGWGAFLVRIRNR